MPSIEILDTGWIDRRDSAFPQAVQLLNGDILCSFNVGGGPNVHGGTDWARSTDGGVTWQLEGTILPPTTDPDTTNALKLSYFPEDEIIFAYGSRSYRQPGEKFGEGRNEPVFCRSTDGGHSWSPPQVVPMPAACPLEISHGILPLAAGRLLAPAATLPSQDRLGDQVLLAISDDGGQTWHRHAVAFQDPNGKHGYFEQKFTEVDSDCVMGVCWTVTLGDVVDLPDSFVLSHDGGVTWSPPHSTGIQGQTMTPIPLGGDRLLVLYNRRYGEQAIMMCLVTYDDEGWTLHHEDILYDAGTTRQRPEDIDSGVEELYSFMFGFPTAIRLQDGTYLATHWCQEDGPFGVRWTKLRVDW